MRKMWTALTALAVMTAIGCGAGGGVAHPDALSGKVTAGGKPVASATLVVTGPEGQSSGGTTNDDGTYLIPEPPKGKLSFQFIMTSNKSLIPAKYSKPNNGLTFDYTGGSQTYDIDLK